jgi:hypothetical protein
MEKYSIYNESIQAFISESFLDAIKNNIPLESTLVSLLYNRHVLDIMRTKLIKADDENWLRERIFGGSIHNDFYKNYLINLFQNFVTADDKESLVAIYKDTGLTSCVFLINKLPLPTSLRLYFYTEIVNNWAIFQEEECYYENPSFEYNTKFIDSFNKRIIEIEGENLNRYWLYLLSSVAIIGKNFTKNQIQQISQKILTLPFGEDEETRSFYTKTILNKIKEYEQ